MTFKEVIISCSDCRAVFHLVFDLLILNSVAEIVVLSLCLLGFNFVSVDSCNY